MNDEIHGEMVETETETIVDGTVTSLVRGEYDAQIATAKQFPRSIKGFVNEATEMATLTQEVAGECLYALRRSGKVIEGPSARLAEILASAWGNCRAGARVISEDGRFVTAQGMFFDLQKNVAIQYEIRRRITDKNGRTFSEDMIGVTANAACSIALRNAVLKGIPKAFWEPIYKAARKASLGGGTLTETRAKMIRHFEAMKITQQQLLDLLELKGVEDIGLDHLALLRGIAQSIKDGETTVEETFGHVPAKGSRVRKSEIDVAEPAQQAGG